MENFYLKVEGGIASFIPVKDEGFKIKLKNKSSAFIELGAGIVIDHSLKIDLTVSHMLNINYQGAVSSSLREILSNPRGKN